MCPGPWQRSFRGVNAVNGNLMKTFTDIQSRLGEPAKGFSPELWTQFMNGQAPLVQGLMGNYLEQSKNLFVQMQEQMAEQAKALFPGLPGFVPPKR